jgi:hypothetical protein
MKTLPPDQYPNVIIGIEWELHCHWNHGGREWAIHMINFLNADRAARYPDANDHRPFAAGSNTPSHLVNLNANDDDGNDIVAGFIEAQIQTFADTYPTIYDGSFPFVVTGFHPLASGDICEDMEPGKELGNLLGMCNNRIRRCLIEYGMNTSLPFTAYWWKDGPENNECTNVLYDPVDWVRGEALDYARIINDITKAVPESSWNNEPLNCLTEATVPEYDEPYILLTSPGGGEYLEHGSAHEITWSSYSLAYTVDITLWKDGASVGTIVEDLDGNSGSYTWTVGDYIGGKVAAGPGYEIKITQDNSSVENVVLCGGTFTIFSNNASISVTSPNGGEDWTRGTTEYITWDAEEIGNIKITLWKDGALLGIIVNHLDPSPGSYAWTVGQHSGGTAAAETGYTIKMKEIGTPVADTSDSDFTILNPSIAITSPNGGENWKIGNIKNITWNATGLSNNIKITLWKDGKWLGVIANHLDPTPGFYTWTVGQHSGGTAAAGTEYEYKVKIKEIGTPVADTSDASFTLTN